MNTVPMIIDRAVEQLKQGQVIAVPTETVYGLAVDSTNSEAIEALYQLKGRPRTKQLPIAIAEPSQWQQIVTNVDDNIQKLMKAFWPGALTIVLSAKDQLGTVAVRCPDNPLLQEIIFKLGKPICLTSANLSGEPSALKAGMVRESFQDNILIIEDDTIVGNEASTIIDVTGADYRILREGVVSVEAIQLVTSDKNIVGL